jgi:hypothetical protein
MKDPLQRLYKAKLALLAGGLVAVGLAALVFGHWVQTQSGWHWLTNWPIIDIGSGLFTTGLLGVALQYIDGQDSEARDTERLRRVLSDTTPAMRDAVISGFAFEPADIARVSTPETLDRIITNGLAIRLGDPDFAAEIYGDLKLQAIGMPERLLDARVNVRLSPMVRAGRRRTDLFAVTMRWEYRLVPAYATRRFVCTADDGEFRDLAQDNAGTSVWYFKPKGGLTADDRHAFELLDFTVDGEDRPIRRTAKADSQTYSVSLGQEAMRSSEPVTVAYTYRSVTAVDGHRLRLRFDQPTRSLSLHVDYTDTDLVDVSVLDYIASGERTRVSRSPQGVSERSLTLEFDGWLFPRSGVAFVW